MFTCISCGGDMKVNLDYGKYQCVECGRFMDGTMPAEDGSPAEGENQRWVLGGILYKGEINPWLRSLIDSLRAQLLHGQREEALKTCHRLIEYDNKFIDAHLWIGRLSLDEEEKEKHLGYALALDPGNLAATRELLVLRGEITEEEAKRSEDLYHDNVQEVEDVEAQSEVLLCPICRGALTVSDGGTVECAFCGYQDNSTANAVKKTRENSLAVAMIKQRGQAVRWKVGERMVHCNECGAERVLPSGKMSSRCPFCHSNHVIVQDNLGAFRQPDGIVKFKVRQSDAERIVHENLSSRMEKVKGWFINNRVARIDYVGVFLPFWVFDLFGKVLINDSYRDMKEFATQSNHEQIPAQLHNIPVPSVNSPPPALLDQISKYDLRQSIAYTPKLLSKYAAELYQVDFDKASLEVRSRFRQAMVEKHANINPNVTRTISTQVDYMEMRLMLMPVWVATILEQDGDLRTVLVNGQNGQAVLGKARKMTR